MGKNRKRRALTDVQGVSGTAGAGAGATAGSASGARDATGAAARKRRRREAKRIADAAAAEAEVQRVAGNALTARADDVLFMVDTKGAAGAAKVGSGKKKAKGKGKKAAGSAIAGAGSGDGAGAAAAKAGAAALATATRPKRNRPSRREKTVAKQKLELFDAWGAPGGAAVQPKKVTARPRRMTQYKPKQHRALRVDHEHPSQVIDAVPVPHAGTSVNPARESHQDALAEVLAAELAAKQDDFVPIATAADDEDGSGGDDDAGSSDASDASDDESGWVGVERRRKDGEKYTRAKRNKIARTKAARRAAAEARREAKLRADLSRAGELKKAMAEKAATKAAEKALKKLARAERLANPKLVEGGKLVDVRPTLDVPLSDELAQSRGRLRSSKVLPAQVLMKEHFTRYKQRRLFETGAKRSQRKAKTRVVGEGEFK